MLKYVLAGLFILVLSALIRQPVPILEGVEVYSEQTFKKSFEKSEIEEEIELNLPQAQIEITKPKLVEHQLIRVENLPEDVGHNTY